MKLTPEIVEQLKTMNHLEIYEWAKTNRVIHGRNSGSMFTKFKRELLSFGIDYDQLREQGQELVKGNRRKKSKEYRDKKAKEKIVREYLANPNFLFEVANHFNSYIQERDIRIIEETDISFTTEPYTIYLGLQLGVGRSEFLFNHNVDFTQFSSFNNFIAGKSRGKKISSILK